MTLVRSASLVHSARAATRVTALPAHLYDAKVRDSRLGNQQQQQEGTGWTTTTAVGANTLTRTTAVTRMTMEGGDKGATEEGNGRGATSGCNKYIIK